MLGTTSVLCGQLLVVGLAGTELSPREKKLLASGERGGVVLFRRNVKAPSSMEAMCAVGDLVGAVTSACPSEFPPLVAIDQEGGRVMRLGPPAMQLPDMRCLGDLDDEDLVERVAYAQARGLASLGITMNFAPVADVHTRESNPIIGRRAFSPRADTVARMAVAFARGLARQGVLACAKHFPGHGDTTVDSHVALPIVDRSRSDLEREELVPFRALARGTTVAAMMTAHVVYPALDARTPATLCRAIATDLLRGDMRFDGVLFSDDLDMGALTMDRADAAREAILAGCDVLLVCGTSDRAEHIHAALVREAETSQAFRARCEEACARSLRMRRSVVSRPVSKGEELARVFERSQTVMRELSARLEAAR